MKQLSIGKLRGLQQTSTPGGVFAICALDHRNNLRQLLRPDAPASVSAAEMTAFKLELVRTVAPATSAVLLDPELSAAQTIAANVTPGRVGVITALEATGYGGSTDARESLLLEGWSAAKAKRMGASGVKLLVYYHPDSPLAGAIEDQARRVAVECRKADLAFFLEPLSYSLDPSEKKLDNDERRRVVIETAYRLSPLGADVLKVEFPLDTAEVRDEQEWRIACSELSQASAIPWVLLSASAGMELFARQVAAACLSGASGVAVGRAVWKEATEVDGQARLDFLRETARPRMERITALVNGIARPWTDFYTGPVVDESWFSVYPE